MRILATVKMPAGQLVGTLSKDDFSIFDNGVAQQFAVFEHHTDQPLSIAMLVDTSGSTAKERKYMKNRFRRSFSRALFLLGRQSGRLRPWK